MATFNARHSADLAQNLSYKVEDSFFNLKGASVNAIVDAATPLLGMILRIQDLASPISGIEDLYQQIVTDIKNIETQLKSKNYDLSVVITFRYVLCAFIDECVMSSESSLANFWSNKSLLIHFHNEGWGGERVFQITERLMAEPKRYKDILEFIYICFCLGFRGRYKVHNANNDEFEQLLQTLGTQILAQNQNQNSKLPFLSLGQVNKAKGYHLPRRLNLVHIIGAAFMVLFISYTSYLLLLNKQSAIVIEQLQLLLN